MKQKLANFIKYNKKVYRIYSCLMNTAVNILKQFVIPDEHLILFNSFAGRKYDDSPKELFEYIKSDKRFANYKLVWAFHDPSQFEVVGAEKIKTDSLKYFITALKARVWVTNSSVERGLNFKGKRTIYLNTWHGTPIKKMGTDLEKCNRSFSDKSENSFDIMNAQSKFEADIFSRVFNIPRSSFLEVGLPRNDKLANYTQEEIVIIKKKLNIPANKKIILYAPTFREYEKDEYLGCVLAPPMDLIKWEENLGKDYILLFRAHYEVSRVMNITENSFVKNMTNYPSLNELMIVSDILISDYSSIFFDYSIMDKVMLHFTYDYDKYSSKRGMYFDIREYLDGGYHENQLIELLSGCCLNMDVMKTKVFREKYVNYYGSASRLTGDELARHLKI